MGATSSRPSTPSQRPPPVRSSSETPRPRSRPTSPSRLSSFGFDTSTAASSARSATATAAARAATEARPSLLKRKSSSAQGRRESRRFSSLQNVLSGQRRRDVGFSVGASRAGGEEGKVRTSTEEVMSQDRTHRVERQPSRASPSPPMSAVPNTLPPKQQHMAATPSLPTSPGPPVLHRAPSKPAHRDSGHMDRSYFEPPTFSADPESTENANPPEQLDMANCEAPIVPAGQLAADALTAPSSHMENGPSAAAGPSHDPSTPVRANTSDTTASPTLTPSARPSRPHRPRGFSLPGPPPASSRTVTGRLSAMLGFSAPTAPELLDSTPSTAAQTPAMTPTMGSFPVGVGAGGSGAGAMGMTPRTPMMPMTPMTPAAHSRDRRESRSPRRASCSDGRAAEEGGVIEGLGLAGVTEASRPAGRPDAATTSEGEVRTSEASVHTSPSQRPIEDLATDIASTRVSLEAELQDLEATAEPDDPTIADMRRELDDLSTEVDRVTRQVENLNARRRELERQPVGAMLVIQGLAQTQMQSADDGEEEGSAATAVGAGLASSGRAASGAQPGAGPRNAENAASGTGGGAGARGTGGGASPRRPTNFRRMSDGSLFRRRREEQEERGASVDQQARMIGGLLTVAAAATANTLLQPPARPSPPARSGMGGAIDNLINRLRPNRSPRRGIEHALGSYLRNVARDVRRAELTGDRNRGFAVAAAAAAAANGTGTAGNDAPGTGATGPGADGGDEMNRAELDGDFQQFLEDLQNDLVGAVRAFAAYPLDEDDDGESISTGEGGSAGRDTVFSVPSSISHVASATASSAEQVSTGAEGSAVPSQGTVATIPQSFSADPTIPTFHRQLGQNLPPSSSHAAPDRNGSTSSSRTGVTGGTGTGQPRTLNFFRAHLFPPTSAEAERQRDRRANLAEGEEDVDDTIVPCIFVGVRSMQGSDEGGARAEELVEGMGMQSPGLPETPGGAVGNGSGSSVRSMGRGLRSRAQSLRSRVGEMGRDTPDVPGTPTPTTPGAGIEQGSYFDALPPRMSDGAGALSVPATPAAEAPPAPMSSSRSHARPGPGTPADSHPHARPSFPRMSSGPTASTDRAGRGRSFRDRVLARLNRRPPPQRAMNTYLVYVVGGNYPRNHPVLRIPALLTGGALTDEEMTLIGELLGPAKPLTASKADIEKSGLKIVDGRDIEGLGEKGEVHQNTVERCLVCLGDYEEGEECRVLQCRHVFHRECVDRWLEQGANSCPACRNQAVDKSAPPTAAAPPSARPPLSRAASALSATPPALSPALSSASIPASSATSPLASASAAVHAQASGLSYPERPLSVVPESDSQAPSPVPSLTAPIDVGSVGELVRREQTAEDDATGS